jgi:septal ring factor EnvC (AmiA/AmiB activator)
VRCPIEAVNLLAANTPLPCRGLSAICRADSGQAAHVRPLDYLCLSRNVVFSPSEKPDNLVLEHLRAMRSDLGKIKKIVVDHAQQLIGLRKQIHALEGNTLRIEEGMARGELRLEKIEKRLELIDV